MKMHQLASGIVVPVEPEPQPAPQPDTMPPGDLVLMGRGVDFDAAEALLIKLFHLCDHSGLMHWQRAEAVQELAVKLLGQELDVERLC